MLEGVTPFPPEFAARYRERGYWQDRSLFDGFRDCLREHADRVALIDAAGPVTYRQLDERSARLARALLDLGVRPLDRIVVQLPNTAVFGYLYFADTLCYWQRELDQVGKEIGLSTTVPSSCFF